MGGSVALRSDRAGVTNILRWTCDAADPAAHHDAATAVSRLGLRTGASSTRRGVAARPDCGGADPTADAG